MEAKKLTDECYLISDSYNNKLGLAFVRPEAVLFTHDLTFYDSIEAIGAKLKENVIYTELPSNEDVSKEIGEYPIKHDVFFEVEEIEFQGEKITTYKTREGSNVVYCSGWWSLTTDSVTRATLSPKVTTLNSESRGPYKTRFDCQIEVTRTNREKHDLSKS